MLASGDPGFFGIVRALRARGLAPHVIPAVSSVALAFARIGLDWDDALVLSAHGRDPRPALAAALAHPKAAILTAPGTARDLATELLANGKTVYAAEFLGTAEEKVSVLSAETALADPNLLIALDPDGAPGEPRWLAGHPGAPDGWALPEDAFEHRDSMITKPEVRALVLARLGPAPGRTIWDVGAGSGSVAVECARFGAHVIAIEADPAQCEKIRRNAERHHVRLRVHHGRARRRSSACRPPTRSSPEAATTPSWPPRSASRARAGSWSRWPPSSGSARPPRCSPGRATGPKASQLQASRLAPLPGGQYRLAAQNPVFVLWGQRGKSDDRPHRVTAAGRTAAERLERPGTCPGTRRTTARRPSALPRAFAECDPSSASSPSAPPYG